MTEEQKEQQKASLTLMERWYNLSGTWQIIILVIWIMFIYEPVFGHLGLIPQDMNIFQGVARTVFDTFAVTYAIFGIDKYLFHGGYEKEFGKPFRIRDLFCKGSR